MSLNSTSILLPSSSLRSNGEASAILFLLGGLGLVSLFSLTKAISTRIMERFPRERTSVIRKGVQPQMAARPILYSHLSCPHDIGCGHSDEEIMDELYNPERVEQRYRALEKKLAEQKMRRAITRSKPIVDVQDEVQTHREAERKKGLDTVEAWANNKKPQEQRGLKTHENSSLERRLEAEKHEAFLAAMRERKQGSKDRRHRKLEALKDLLRAEKKEAMKDYLNFECRT